MAALQPAHSRVSKLATLLVDLATLLLDLATFDSISDIFSTFFESLATSGDTGKESWQPWS